MNWQIIKSRRTMMPKFFKHQQKAAGLPPGTLIHIGEKKTEKVNITVIDYNEERIEERVVKKIDECYPYCEKPTVTWINIDGLHKVNIIEKIGTQFKLHPLLLEDVLNTDQRPKMEDFEHYLFIILKMLLHETKLNDTSYEQVSIILGPNYVITFQERGGDVFNSVRDRIRNGRGRIRKMGSDYLAYALIDAIVDNYFVVLENIGEKLEGMEIDLMENPTPQTLQKIHKLKRDMIFLRKSIWPLREVVSGLQRLESELIKEGTGIFFRDVYDHTIQVIDTIETYRDMLSGMLDLYLSMVSNKMNEIMKVLTIIATIFIPLTFIAGIYGMNFDPDASPLNMPELGWYWGYIMAWAAMIVVVILMVIYFKTKKWL
jgi:magnesium transporter